ncbi:MAG: hypothetical protein ACRYFX_26185 [Janthinobacterium lividum]
MKKPFISVVKLLVMATIVLFFFHKPVASWLGQDVCNYLEAFAGVVWLTKLLAHLWATFDFNTRVFSSRAEQVYWREKIFSLRLGNVLWLGDLEYLYHFRLLGAEARSMKQLR